MPTIRRTNLNRLFLEKSPDDVTGFGKMIGKSQSATSDLLAGRKSFGEKMARSIEKNLGIPLYSLDSALLVPGFEPNTEPGPALGKFMRVPVVGTAQLGDNGYWAELEHGDGYILFPVRDKNAYSLRCRGDSMRPRIKEGEFVIVEPNSAYVAGDEILICAKDGRVMVKTFLYLRDDRLHVMSINETHPPQTFKMDEIEKIHAVTAIVKQAMWNRANE